VRNRRARQAKTHVKRLCNLKNVGCDANLSAHLFDFALLLAEPFILRAGCRAQGQNLEFRVKRCESGVRSLDLAG
jgi:hypothetical protein